MSYITLLQTNFSQGEISPWVYGRTDITQFQNSARRVKNFIPRPQGGLNKRPGTEFINYIANQANGLTRLFTFIYADNDAYVLEFGDGYIRFYRNGGLIESSPGVPYEVATTYLYNQVPDLQIAQVYDSLYIVHPAHPPRVLKRFSHASWTLTEAIFTDGPYFGEANPQYGGKGSGISITPSAATGSITITASANLFVATDVGRFIRYRKDSSSAWGWAIITSYTSPLIVGATVQSPLGSNTISNSWTLGSWSTTTGYPAVISFFEQRMILAGSPSQPQTVWMSKSADITNFSPDNDDNKGGVDANTAMDYTIYSSGRACIIYWVRPQRGLYIGTSDGVFLAKASNSNEALTPNNISITNIIANPVAPVIPVTVGNITLFSDEFRRRIQEIKYSFQEDAFKSPDIALLAEHCTKGLTNFIISANYPNYLIWMADRNGDLYSVTYVPDQNITAWATHQLGGNGKVESIVSIPGASENEVWMIVRRTINGNTARYIERFTTMFLEQDVTDSKFVDCHIGYSGTPTDSFSGLGHLEGETVQCFGDGATIVVTGTGKVTGGAISLQRKTSKAVVGLPYESIIETNQLTSQSAPAALQGRVGRIQEVVLRLYRSYGGDIGISDSHMDIMPGYGSHTIMDGPLNLQSGDMAYPIPSEYNLNPNMIIRHTLPVPFSLLSIVLKASVSSR